MWRDKTQEAAEDEKYSSKFKNKKMRDTDTTESWSNYDVFWFALEKVLR